MFHNQWIYKLRRLESLRNKTTAVDSATGRTLEFCWMLESDWTREVCRFNLNHLDCFCASAHRISVKKKQVGYSFCSRAPTISFRSSILPLLTCSFYTFDQLYAGPAMTGGQGAMPPTHFSKSKILLLDTKHFY